MIQTMLCIWWLLLILAIVGTSWLGWETWKAGGETEGYDFIGYGICFAACFVFALLAAATICAIKLSS